MNETVSSQLFHFTGFDKSNNAYKPDEDAFNTLQSILYSQYLRLSTNEVEIHLPQGAHARSINVKIKMACLTETPIRFLSQHMKKYGKFGLGFSVEWALINGGLNVIYVDNNKPNSFAQTISELEWYFIENGALAHDRRAISLITQLATITERFEFREEREWRFFRAPKMPNGDLGILFTSTDLQTIICPHKFIPRIQEILTKINMNPKIISTESVMQ